MSLVTGLQRTFIRWMQRRHASRDKVEIKNFEKIKRVCLLTSLSVEDTFADLKRVKTIYSKHNKFIDIIVYFPSKDLPDELIASDFKVLSKRDLNKAGLFNKDFLNGFRKGKYDLFLYYNPDTLIPLEHAASYVDALINVGYKTEKEFEPDITIYPKSPGMIHFIDTVNSYLKNINKVL